MSGGFSEKLVLVRVGEKFELASVELLEVNFIDLLIDSYNHICVLACCFFFPCRVNGMPDNSSTNALVSSIYSSMNYLGYVHFFTDSLSLLF